MCVCVCMHLSKTMVSDRLKFLISSAIHFLIQLLTCSCLCLSICWLFSILDPSLASSWMLIPAWLYSSSLPKELLSELYAQAIASAVLLCHHFSILLFWCPLNFGFPWFLWTAYMVVLLLHLLCLPCCSYCLSAAIFQIHIHFSHLVPLPRINLSDSRQGHFRV